MFLRSLLKTWGIFARLSRRFKLLQEEYLIIIIFLQKHQIVVK